MSDGMHHVGRNENVTILATCQNYQFFLIFRKVMSDTIVVDIKKDSNSFIIFFMIETLIKNSVRHVRFRPT